MANLFTKSFPAEILKILTFGGRLFMRGNLTLRDSDLTKVWTKLCRVLVGKVALLGSFKARCLRGFLYS